ncbi:hypothetical protein ANN_21041 [Periplaneta americana]|uniref:Uncharacterized protein n=1 Tax=Periplaneta americana TaxID=6978 RepID=A0ABQ8SFF2_PERAM|nr:hypothetical protein ANN_21041 [Periplaneta americana]
MAGLCEGGNEPPGSLKASDFDCIRGLGSVWTTVVSLLLEEVGVKYIKEHSSLFNDAVSTARLFSIDGIGDSKMVFREMRPRIRHIRVLHDIRFTAVENLEKPNYVISPSWNRTRTRAQLWIGKRLKRKNSELFYGKAEISGRQHSLKCAKCKRWRPVCTVVQQEEIESIPASSYECTMVHCVFRGCVLAKLESRVAQDADVRPARCHPLKEKLTKNELVKPHQTIM